MRTIEMNLAGNVSNLMWIAPRSAAIQHQPIMAFYDAINS